MNNAEGSADGTQVPNHTSDSNVSVDVDSNIDENENSTIEPIINESKASSSSTSTDIVVPIVPIVTPNPVPVQPEPPTRSRVDMDNLARNVIGIIVPLITRSPPVSSHPPNFKHNFSSSLFSFAMTVIFVSILWLVVYILFGFRGHAIVGVFIVIFVFGLLLNSFFLKLFFRFRVAAGMREEDMGSGIHSHNIQVARMNDNVEETPPSYASVVDIPPPYNFLQFYKQRKISKTSVKSNTSSIDSENRFMCPMCRTKVISYGLCDSCELNLRE